MGVLLQGFYQRGDAGVPVPPEGGTDPFVVGPPRCASRRFQPGRLYGNLAAACNEGRERRRRSATMCSMTTILARRTRRARSNPVRNARATDPLRRNDAGQRASTFTPTWSRTSGAAERTRGIYVPLRRCRRCRGEAMVASPRIATDFHPNVPQRSGRSWTGFLVRVRSRADHRRPSTRLRSPNV